MIDILKIFHSLSLDLLGVGPSIDIDDEGVLLGLREVWRKIKTNLTT